ncbi:MAG: alpha/beta hydrolase [Pacificimonas sp.]
MTRRRKLSYILLALLLLPVGAAATIGFVYLRSPPSALDLANDLTPDRGTGERAVRMVVDGAPFGQAGLNLDVFAPDNIVTEKRPVIVFWYGGAWVKGERESYAFVARAFAARGYVVILPDYRKVPNVRFPVFVADGAAALAWTAANIARFGGDPDRIAVAGHSAGAYIAAMLALDTRYTEALPLPDDIVKAVIGLAGPYDFYPFTSDRAEAAMGYAANPLETQPIAFASEDAPPMLLANGSADTVVRPKNARALGLALRKAGNDEVTVKIYDGASHNDLITPFARLFRDRYPVLNDSIDFLSANGLEAE